MCHLCLCLGKQCLGNLIFYSCIMRGMEASQDLIIFTDGSSRGNPGPGGWGALIMFQKLDELVELGGNNHQTTNNEMELTAVVAALSYVENNRANLHLYTDSQYVINGITAWVFGWEKNGWKKKDGEPVMHTEIWQQLLGLVRARGREAPVTWHHVPGHIGIAANERADTIANTFAGGKDVKLYRGTLSGYSNQSMVNIPSDDELAVARAEKKEGKTASSGKAYVYLSLVEGELQRHDTWAECEARVKGQKAKFRKATSPEHEQEILAEWGISS